MFGRLFSRDRFDRLLDDTVAVSVGILVLFAICSSALLTGVVALVAQ